MITATTQGRKQSRHTLDEAAFILSSQPRLGDDGLLLQWLLVLIWPHSTRGAAPHQQHDQHDEEDETHPATHCNANDCSGGQSGTGG